MSRGIASVRPRFSRSSRRHGRRMRRTTSARSRLRCTNFLKSCGNGSRQRAWTAILRRSPWLNKFRTVKPRLPVRLTWVTLTWACLESRTSHSRRGGISDALTFAPERIAWVRRAASVTWAQLLTGGFLIQKRMVGPPRSASVTSPRPNNTPAGARYVAGERRRGPRDYSQRAREDIRRGRADRPGPSSFPRIDPLQGRDARSLWCRSITLQRCARTRPRGTLCRRPRLGSIRPARLPSLRERGPGGRRHPQTPGTDR